MKVEVGMKRIGASFAVAVCIAAQAMADDNLIKNGTFEGTASQNAWGAYANQGNFSCSDWEFLSPDRAGLGKPNGTWMASGLEVGDFALFIQTQSGNQNVIVRQKVTIQSAGRYRASFKYAGRPGQHLGATTCVEFVDGNGVVTEVGSVTSTMAGLQTFFGDVTLQAGEYYFQFRQSDTLNKDVANVFEDVSLRLLSNVVAIGETGYDNLAVAMTACEIGDTISYHAYGSDDGELSGATIVWSGHMPTIHTVGTLTFSGANTLAVYASHPGTYTLFSAGSIVMAQGATLALDTPVTDGLVRTLTVGATAVTLEVALDPNRTEMVINGDFDLPGTSAGTRQDMVPLWSYSYATGGFVVPWWNYPSYEEFGYCAGITSATGTWLATAQTNGGVYSFYGQREIAGVPLLAQDFGATPAGVYRFSFNYATRPGYMHCIWNARVVKDGTAIHSMKMGEITNTTLTNKATIISIGAAGSYGLEFLHQSPDGNDHSAVIDDIHFMRVELPGWSIIDEVTCFSGTAEVPAQSFIDGDALFASGATISTYADRFLPSLRVDGALSVRGPVTITLPNSYTTEEGYFKIIEAKSMTLENGAYFVLDPNCRFLDTETNANYAYQAELVTTDRAVYLHLYNVQPSGNNYYKPAHLRGNDLWTTAANWVRGHTPQSGDGNILFNHPGTLVFNGAYSNSANLHFYVRSGINEPLVFDATDDAYGYDFGAGGDYFHGVQGNGCAGWMEFRRGTYGFRTMYVNGTGNTGYETVARVDITGATLNLSSSMQFGYSVDALSELNMSAGSLTMASDYNTTINARSMHRLRLTGGKISVNNFQAAAQNSAVFDGEITDGELEARTSLKIGFPNAVGSRSLLRVKGGKVRAADIVTFPGRAEFLFDGGTLSPYATSAAWLEATSNLTVVAGKNAIVDTEGLNVTWCTTLQDDAGGANFGFVKRGDGALTAGKAQTISGTVAVEKGSLVVPAGTFAATAATVSPGATLSLVDGAAATFALQSLVLEGGAVIAVDATAEGGDTFAAANLDISAASVSSPIVVNVSPVGFAELPVGVTYTVIASGVGDADIAKFMVAGVDADLAVVDGALVMSNSGREKVSVEWNGAASDGGKWSTGGNWVGGTSPLNGDTAVFNLAGSGTTLFDKIGLALGCVHFPATAGQYVHEGTDSLRVTRAVTNLSSNVQTFKMPVSLGVSGHEAEVNTAGDLVFTGDVVTVASTLVKKGAGTLAIPDRGLMSAGDVVVEEGTLRIDEHTGDETTKRAGETPYSITVKDGARLDVNVSGGNGVFAASEPTHGRAVVVEGAGPDGAGALYNSNHEVTWGAFFSQVTLTGDTKAGGGHLSVRGLDGSALAGSQISGEQYTLTLDNSLDTHGFNFHSTEFNLKRVNVTGKTQFEQPLKGTVQEGFNFYDGSYLRFWTTSVPETIPLSVEPGAAVTFEAGSAVNSVNGTFTVGEGATVNATAAQPLVFYGPVVSAGTFVQVSGNIYFAGPSLSSGGTYTANGNHLWFAGSINSPESEISIGDSAGIVIFGDDNKAPGTGLPKLAKINASTVREVRIMPRASVTVDGDLYSDVVGAAVNLVAIDSVEAAATVTLKNATWNLQKDFYLGAYNRSGHFVIGEGATVTVPGVLYTSYNNTAPQETYLEVARGGTLNWTEADKNGFHIGRGTSNDTTCKPQRVAVTGGTLNADNGTVLVGVDCSYNYFDLIDGYFSPRQIEIRHRNNYRGVWGKAHEELFTQKGGTFALGRGGMRSTWPNWEKPHANLQGGLLKARENFANKYGYMNIQFGSSPMEGGEYEIDLNGQNVDWNAPLLGTADVTISGEGTFTSAAALQSIPLGHWYVAAAQPINLSGAAGFAGGLTLAPNAYAQLSIEGEGLVEWAMFNTDQLADLNAMKGFTGICPYVSTTLAHVHKSYAGEASKPMGNNTGFIYRGQFLVEDGKAGTWCFAGTYDDNIWLEIDGQEVLTGTAHDNVGKGSADLTAGWHDFRVIVRDGTGDQGPRLDAWKTAGMGLGWSSNPNVSGSEAPGDYARFDTSTLTMRLPQASTSRTGVRMRTVGASGTGNASTYMNDDLVFTRCDCVTNTLDVLLSAEPAGGTTARFDGYFLVPEENAGEWSFTGRYDDRIALKVDGVLVFATTAHNVAQSGTATLTAGWHRFCIYTTDTGGGWGGNVTDDNGVTCGVKAKPANGEKTLAFSGDNFQIVYSAQDLQKTCRTGLGGVTTLGEGSTLSNRDGVSPNGGGCPIYGTLAGAGSLDGFFRFVGEDSTLSVTGAGGRLTAAPNLDDVVNSDCVKGLAKVTADFPDVKPNALRYALGPAGTLTAQEAKAIDVTVTLPGGATADDWYATVVNGRLSIVNPHPGGFTLILR